MYSDNKQIRDVADVAAKIMYGQQPVTEKLHPNQQQLDVHEPEKDELTADDFKKLRAGKKPDVKKEEAEQQEEALSHQAKTTMKHIPNPTPAQKQAAKDIKPGVAGYRDRIAMLKDAGVKEEVGLDEGLQQTLRKYVPGYAKAQLNKKMDAQNYVSGDSTKKTVDKDVNYNRYKKVADKLNKEEVEELEEVKMADLPSTKVQGRSYGASKPEPHAVDTLRGPKEKELKDIEAENKKKQKKFSEMVNLYQEKGLKSLSEMLVKEEPDNEQFTKELEDAKAKSEGKKRNTEIAKGSVQAVKQEELDIDAINGVQMSTIEERMMTEPEKEKKEDIVKSMKKGMAGFKERYGSRANDVMYATATKNAMKD